MISDFYTQSLTLLSTSTGSTGGYWSTSTGPTYTTGAAIPAAVNLLSGSELAHYGAIGVDARYKAYCAVSTEVYHGRHCLWGGDSYIIVDEPKNTLQRDHHFKILLRDVGNA